MKKQVKIILAALILALFGVVGFFLVSKFGIFSKRQAVYSQQKNSVSELAGNSQQPIDNNQQSITNNQQTAINNQQSAEDSQQSVDNSQQATDNNQKTSNQPPVNDDKVIKKNTDDEKSVETKAAPGKIVNKLVSWGFQKSSGRTIKAIIIHTSYNAIGGDVFDFNQVIQEWKDAGVAPHYAIDREGVIYQLVGDQNIAWHAGASKLPDGTTDVNGASIGIEVINSKDAKFTSAQYTGLNSLIATLSSRYDIKYVLGHDDIAPGRKSDPWGIDWGKVKR